MNTEARWLGVRVSFPLARPAAWLARPRARVISLLARLLVLTLGVILACVCTPAQAQDGKLWNLRETASLGLMTSSDQILLPLGFDRAALLAGVQAGRSLLPWLELHGGLQAAGFWGHNVETGGLFDVTAGGLLRVERRGLSPYVSADFGGGVTGDLVRPYLMLTAGLDAKLVGTRHKIGPVFGYGQLFQKNGYAYSTDARFLFFGISVRHQLGREPAPPAQTRTIHDWRVIREREPAIPPEPPAAPEPGEDVLKLIERALPNTTQRVEMLAPVLFNHDSDRLEPTGVAMLHEVRQTLDTRPDIKLVQIEGYADQRGNPEYNRALSERRAERVKTWLVEHGIAAERLRVAPLGETGLVEPGTDAAAHEQNRRVVFRILEQEATP